MPKMTSPATHKAPDLHGASSTTGNTAGPQQPAKTSSACGGGEFRERPIPFSGEMVSAILDGRKTQTRRVMKPQPGPGFLARGVVGIVPQWPLQDGVRWFMADGLSTLIPCPYGRPGDRLKVRETWATTRGLDHVKPSNLVPGFPGEFRAGGTTLSGVNHLCDRGRWRPSIFLPHWASRITLEIVSGRVERLQEITEADALKEGFGCGTYTSDWSDKAKPEFRQLWDKINGKNYPWSSNPFVWVVEFRRLG